jgi:hypothetical protein
LIDERQRKAADAQFKKDERATQSAKAMSEYNAEREAERAKTVRLPAQRLAEEAAGKKMSNATAAIVFLALSIAVIALAAMVVQVYFRGR